MNRRSAEGETDQQPLSVEDRFCDLGDMLSEVRVMLADLANGGPDLYDDDKKNRMARVHMLGAARRLVALAKAEASAVQADMQAALEARRLMPAPSAGG